MSDISENISEITTKLPSYLKILLQENFNIKLVYQQKNEHGKACFKVENIEECDETAVSALDLTGTPLVTDLGGNDSICVDVIPVIPPSWTAEEIKYHPISLEQARTYINVKLQRSELINKPIFCLCNGSDVQNTVVLGLIMSKNKLTRVLVYVLTCYDENHEITTMEYMRKDHVASVMRKNNRKIQFLITKCYYIWGYDMKNCASLENMENNGSVAIEVSSNKVDTKDSNSYIHSKMILQVIIGHSDSQLKLFWEELVLIQSFINLLVNPHHLSESSVISGGHLNYEELTLSLRDLLTKNVNYFKHKVNEKLDLKNLRQETVLDKLWQMLKSCSNLSDLRDSLHFFFEELHETQAKLQILDDDMSTVAAIANGIKDGRIAVPSLSLIQCLEVLVDLGLEKLKHDYVVLINYFCSSVKDAVLKRWSKLCSESAANSTQITQRKSRISLNPKSTLTDISASRQKLSYLDYMHKAIELMFLCRDIIKLSEESFDQFCEAVYTEFLITNESLGTLLDINKPRLCEFVCDKIPLHNSISEELSPVNWSVRMTSTMESSEVTTVFHFSEFPIFPPSLFDNYDLCVDNSNIKSLHVTKLVKYSENI